MLLVLISLKSTCVYETNSMAVAFITSLKLKTGRVSGTAGFENHL